VEIFMSKLFKIPLVLEPQEEGGWTVTSPVLPILIDGNCSLLGLGH